MKGLNAAFCALLAAAAAGCATQGYEKGANTASQVRAVGESVERLKKQSETTLAAMATLLGQPREGLKEKFEAFSREVDAYASADADYRGSVSSMKRSAEDRFRSWEHDSSQIGNAEMRAKSGERRSEVMNVYKGAETAADELAAVSAPYLTDLQDLRKVLSIDLTPGGIDAANSMSGKIKDGSKKVDAASRPVVTAVGKAADALAAGQESAAPAAAPPPEQTPATEAK
jgi:hypothetical protein